MTNQYFGMLVSKSKYIGLKRGRRTLNDVIREEAAKKNNLIPCYIRFRHIKSGSNQVSVIIFEDGRPLEKKIPYPRVIYNLVWASPYRNRKIQYLDNKGVLVFNKVNYLEKYKFQTLLEANKEFLDYLPETQVLNAGNLKGMMKKYDKLILKPDHGYVGRGIMKLYKEENELWCLTYKVKQDKKFVWKEERFIEGNVPNRLRDVLDKDFYLIQNIIPLATYKGSPFDFRVSTQRNQYGNWEVTAIIGKVAPEGNFLTNIGQGGTQFSIEELLLEYPHLNAKELKDKMTSLALKIANYFSQTTEQIGDLGFDLAITPKGEIYYIECNFCSAYKALTIRDGKLVHDEWRKVFTTPVDYARYLLNDM